MSMMYHLDKAFQNGYYKEMTTLIRGMFGEALKTNDSLQFAVLTGCLRVSKESIFTGLNNFKVVSITDSRFDEQFGFTDEEVQRLLADYHLKDHIEETKEWYDGYHFGDTDVYCPWDVVKSCRLPSGRSECRASILLGSTQVEMILSKKNLLIKLIRQPEMKLND